MALVGDVALHLNTNCYPYTNYLPLTIVFALRVTSLLAMLVSLYIYSSKCCKQTRKISNFYSSKRGIRVLGIIRLLRY